jgi:hypothetical protein
MSLLFFSQIWNIFPPDEVVELHKIATLRPPFIPQYTSWLMLLCID